MAGEGGSFEITATDRHGNLCEVALHLASSRILASRCG